MLIHALVEYPAHRIALASRSLDGKHKEDRVVVITVQVSIAFLLLPVFLAAWLLVVAWNIMYTVFYSFLVRPRAKWEEIQSQTQRRVETKERREFKKKPKDQEAAEEDTGKEADRATIQEDKKDKTKQLRRKTSDDDFKEKRRNDRKEEDKELKKQVALLIPKQLIESNEEGVISKRKKTVRMSNSSEENDMQSLREIYEGNYASAGPITPPQEQASIISTIMSVFRHQSDKALASKEAV